MFELAKTVLSKAGGTSTTSLFTQPTSNQNPRGPQRALHMCAFQIGLYALGLHNRVSPNWISRTYSSHVSWITGQAMEIGATAIKFLIGTWEGHLTPPEAANIADRASRGRDSGIVAAAAELALSCLSHAHALNPNEIAKAILQCKEQSDLQLEKACLAVEEAARGGGVYPEVMFTVARHWYELWKTRAPGPRQEENRHPHGAGVPPPAVSEANVNHHMQQFQPPVSTHQIPGIPLAGNHMQVGMQFPIYSLIHGYPNSMPPQIPLQMQMYVGHPHHPMLSGLPVSQAHQGGYAQFPGLAGAGLANMPGMHMFPNVTTAAGTHPPYNMAAGGPLFQLAAMSNIQGMQMPLMPNPPTSQHMQQGVPLMPHPAPAASPLQPPGGGGPPPTSPANHAAVNGNVVYQRYLLSSFRVGMLALETLGRRVSEDRPQNKFTRNPSYADDVKWLLNVAKKIGLPYLQNFLMCVMATVVSPYLLQDLTWECGCFFAGSPPGTGSSAGSQQHSSAASQQLFVNAVIQQIRTQPYLTAIAQKCYQTYYQSIHQKIYHLTPGEYDDFTSIILHARKAFLWTGNGQNEFQNLLSSLRRTKSCKKELWSKITAAVQNANLTNPPQ